MAGSGNSSQPSGTTGTGATSKRGRKPELHSTSTHAAYATFSLATNETLREKGQAPRERTDSHRVVAWGRTGAACSQHLDVGRQVLVRGKLRTRSWTDREGVQRWSTEVLADRVIFLGTPAQQTSEPVEHFEPPPPEDAPLGADQEIPP